LIDGRYWHENAVRKPPPPGAVCVLVVTVTTVPAAEVEPAVAVQVDPAVEVVEQLMIVLPAVHTLLAVDALTDITFHVTAPPT
jgi:hypothetical protein